MEKTMDPSIISLLKLLKDLLPPDVYKNIILNIIGLMESTDAILHRAVGRDLMAWVRKFYPQYERLMDMILRRVAPTVAEDAVITEGTAAAALGAAEVAAILAAIAAIAFAIWAIWAEANTKLYTPTLPATGGAPCNSNTPGGRAMAGIYRTVSVWGWGSRSTLNKAIKAAEAICNADAAKCGTGGGCGGGLTCQPDVAIQQVDSFNGVLATRVVLGFTCPCVCK
jgi:hypothetical protein